MTALPPNPFPANSRSGVPTGIGFLQITCNNRPKRRPRKISWQLGANPKIHAEDEVVDVPSGEPNIKFICSVLIPAPAKPIVVIPQKTTVVVLGFNP